MPLYDYQCEACGVFEMMRKLVERDAPMSCPRCAQPVERIQTSAALLLALSEKTSEAIESTGSYGMRHRRRCTCC
jgi:putative FmdB family regulatory protein